MMARRSQADLALDPVLVLVVALALALALVLVLVLVVALPLAAGVGASSAAQDGSDTDASAPASLLCVMHSQPFHDARRDTTADTSRWMTSGGAVLSARLGLTRRV